MIRRFISTLVGAGLIVGGVLSFSGCSSDPDQASRESISAPRKAGGVIDTAGEKMKPKAKPKGGRPTAD